MAKLPTQLNPIYEAIERRPIVNELRPYLGFSIYGHQCANYLWLTFRWAYQEEISPRQQRLFNRGHNEEPIVVQDLENAGIQCKDVCKNQIEVVGFMGHMKGHPDGSCINIPGAEKTEHNLEIKTANDKKFSEFVKFGVQRSNPQYYAQSLAYMHYKEQTRTLFVITNKNNDERHYERIHHDEQEFTKLEERAIDIILSPLPMPKLSDRPEWYECKWCAAKEVCHHGSKPLRNCRTCSNSTLHDKGEWQCKQWPGKPIPVEFQRTGCQDGYSPLF